MPELFGITVFVTMLAVAGLTVVLGASLRVIREYERGVLFRFGRVSPENVKKPGLRVIIPVVDRLLKVSPT